MLAKLTTLNIGLLIVDGIVLIAALLGIFFSEKVSAVLKNKSGTEPENIRKYSIFLLICAAIAFITEIVNISLV